MFLKTRLNINFKINDNIRQFSSLANLKESDENLPEYPPIIDLSKKARKEQRLEKWKHAVQNVKTVEEKLMKINMPKYYGWNSAILSDNAIPFNTLPLIQHATRTFLIKQNKLPQFYKTQNEENLRKMAKDIKSQIEKILEVEMNLIQFRTFSEDPMPSEKENIVTSAIVEQINRTVLNYLSEENRYLTTYEIDIDPRHEAFWFAGGFTPGERLRKTRENCHFQKEFANDSIDRAFQYIGSPFLTLRSELPLLPIISLNESTNTDFKIPHFTYNPKTFGYTSAYRHGTNIPGFWPSDQYKFGVLQYTKRGYLQDRELNFAKYPQDDNLESLDIQGILSSFGWLHAQACYQGFSTYNELTYPLVTQNIITNGQYWSFYVYQLNTTLVHGKNIETNPRKNVCWATEPQKLYEEYDVEKTQFKNFNEEVLVNLLQFYLNKPQERTGVNMTPYLDSDEKIIADIQDLDKRQWLEKHFKHMMSNRPRHKLKYEIYDWERIYKIENKTRPLEPRRRPFELKNNNPLSIKRYDHHHPQYVPKKLRPEGTKRKNQNKWEKTYYP